MLRFAVSVSLFVSTLAWAYIPPSQFLIRMLARKHSGYKSVEIHTQVSSGTARFRVRIVYEPASGVLRSWALDSSDTVLYASQRTAKDVPPVVGVRLDSHPLRLGESLKSANIQIRSEPDPSPSVSPLPPESTSLHRWEKTVAWVIGSDATQPTAQLWIEKDSFLPIRWVSASEDVRMEQYRTIGEFPYPQLVQVYGAGSNVPILTEELVGLKVDENANKEIEASGLTTAGNAASSEVRDLIAAYFRYL